MNGDKRFLFICGKEGHHTVLAPLCLCLVDSCCCLPLLGYAGLNHYSVKGLPLMFWKWTLYFWENLLSVPNV